MSEKQAENRQKRKAPRSAWKPGQTGNPKGRPRLGNSLAEAMRGYLEGKERGKQRKQALVEKLYEAATGINGVPATRLIVETLSVSDLESRLDAVKAALERIEGIQR